MTFVTLVIHCVNGDIHQGVFPDSGLSGARHFLREHEHEGQALSLTLANGRVIIDHDEVYTILNKALTQPKNWSPQ